jgi:hypothetical protein
MMIRFILGAAVVLAIQPVAFGQRTTTDPFPTPITSIEGVITVGFTEFATIPPSGDAAPRVMTMLHDAATKRSFASDMIAKLASISLDGKLVTPFLALNKRDGTIRQLVPGR